MNKLLLALILLTICLTSVAYYLKVIYFPFDILNLLPSYHTKASFIPHNTLVSDPVFQFEPWRHFVAINIYKGIFPLWNNLNAGGVPLFANAQSSVLFPLNFIYYVLPPSVSLNLIPLVKLDLLFLFSFLYLRSLKISSAVSCVGALAVCFAGFSMVWLLWPHTNVYIFLPLFLFITEKIRDDSKRKMWGVALSFSYCIAIFGGHYETLLHIMLLHIPYAFLRLQFDVRKFLSFLLFVILGILLSSVQLVPFLEYFLNSSAFAYRMHSSYLYLPLQSSVLNILPFLSGAPHLSHYRPIVTVTNFQESIGGYTGTIIILTAFVGAVTLGKKISLIKIWSTNAVIFWLLAFKIWPFGLLLELPLMSQVQNSRLSSIAAFATVIVFTMTIEKKSILLKKGKKILPLTFGLVTFGLFCSVLFIEILTIATKFNIFRHPYITQLNTHIIFIAFTTLLFIPALYIKKIRFNIIFIIVLITLQTFYLFAGYVPFLNASDYYPNSSVIEKLKTLPRGTILEVGNPSIPPDINLMYDLPLAQNYDGIEVKKYQEEFNKAFPSKNHWGKVESVDIKSLKKFGISYVLSDYNINNQRQEIQSDISSIIGPIKNGFQTSVTFRPLQQKISQVRFLTANYNKKNSCTLTVAISNNLDGINVLSRKINCSELLDKMFYTLTVPNTTLNINSTYRLTFTSNGTDNNTVGLWGSEGKPFVEILYSNERPYELIGVYNTIWLFRVPNSSLVNLDGDYKILQNESNKLTILYTSSTNRDIEIKKTYYPGWSASLDSEKIPVLQSNPFIKIGGKRGTHVLSLYYQPFSFKVGSLVSVFVFILLSIFLIRAEKEQTWYKKLSKQYSKSPFSILKKENRGKVVMTFSTSLILCLIIFFIVINFLPTKDILLSSTSINWLTLHKHSLEFDYLFIFILILLIVAGVLVSWVIILWREGTK